jgi:GNAT superfamily N-acetyltransferase
MIEIRTAVWDDIPVIADFQVGLADETENVTLDRPTVIKGLQALMNDPAKGSYSVAVINGEIIGCNLVTYEWSEWRNGNVWWLQSVYVKRSHRKLGVFKLMYDHRIAQIKKDPELLGLRLYVDKSNLRAQQVYTTLGMNGEHYTVYEWMK